MQDYIIFRHHPQKYMFF